MSSSIIAIMTPKSTPTKEILLSVSDSPGNWQHPRLKEISQRRARSSFNEDNVRKIIYNGITIVLLLASWSLLASRIPHALSSVIPANVKYFTNWAYFLLILLPVANIALACLPLIRPKDDFSDIPLTPGQRKVLGLPPSAKPSPPSAAISTPPRYSRTPSLAGSAASYSSSPLSNKGSPLSDRRRSGSPMASPLLHKAMNGAVNGGRRTSFGSPSHLGLSSSSSLFGGEGPASPSPAPSKRASIGLTNKWLYEKGRRSSGGSWQQ